MLRKQYKIPDSNCAIVNCGTSRYHEEVSLFKLPAPKDEFHRKWWKDRLNINKRL